MKRIINKEEAKILLDEFGSQFAVVQNPDYVHPSFELYPLAEKSKGELDRLTAAVMDMDGTTTTTEELCIHSLEFMVRKMSGKLLPEQWIGLDSKEDYPNIIGNSTTKHVEYLINKYENAFVKNEIINSFLEAALWTVFVGQDESRREEVKNNLRYFGLSAVLVDKLTKELVEDDVYLNQNLLNSISKKYLPKFPEFKFNDLVRVGIDIYYARYHQILERIKHGESEKVSTEIFNDANRRLIEPMPAVSIFLPLIKGWLGNEAGRLSDELVKYYREKTGKELSTVEAEGLAEKLNILSAHFQEHPSKVSVVTSSIYYEAEIVLAEVFNVMSSQIASFNLSDDFKTFLLEKFADPQNYYDAIVSASDSSEMRLKPHRDLYSIALHRLGIPKNEFKNVIGFEDIESGNVAIRAAGIGLAVAVPFAQTSGHNLESASYICHGGLAEVIIKHNCFLRSS